MPSEQVLREEAALVAAATQGDESRERTGLGTGFKFLGEVPMAIIRGAALRLELLLVRWLAEGTMEDYLLGPTIQGMVSALKREVVDEMGYIPCDWYGSSEEAVEILEGLVSVKVEGSHKPRGRTPKEKDWQSDIETTKSRMQKYPRRWDKGGEGGLWLGEPCIVVWVGGKQGTWKMLKDAWAHLLQKGADNERWKKRWWPKEGGGWTPGLLIGGLKTLGWADWEKPCYFKKILTRALREDQDEGSEQVDVLDRIPYKSLKGVNYVQYIFAPGIGIWSDLGLEFRKEMKKLGIRVGVSVAVLDDQPGPDEEPCSKCTMTLNKDGSCPAKVCIMRRKQAAPKPYTAGLIGKWLALNTLRVR